ncbi:MarR family transcriptional regulator [Desulfovibrio sp. OttesenSCG-928-M14]|nr:MarR family transcriptional regulator [Desulfovibrio sp. OttesenSCG-928-M14]
MNTFYYDADNSLGFMSITVNRLLNGFFRRQLAAAGIDLTGEQWGVLAQIWNRGGMSQEELAHIACVDKSSLSRVLRLMESRGLIERRKSGSDGRRKLLYSTPLADSMQQKALESALLIHRQVLEGISEDEIAITFAVLERVKSNIRSQS